MGCPPEFVPRCRCRNPAALLRNRSAVRLIHREAYTVLLAYQSLAAEPAAIPHGFVSRRLARRSRDHRRLRRTLRATRRRAVPAHARQEMSRRCHGYGRALRVSRILIIVQNLPVPFDRRVWLECQALLSAGHEVVVVCPKGRGDPGYAVIDSVQVYKYRPYAPGGSKASFVIEYVYSFLVTAYLAFKARRTG